MYSFTEENYLKAILFLTMNSDKGASTNAIATRLSTTPASVSDMLRRLAEKELLIYRKYQGVTLTEEGRKVAMRTLRKHRLWEVFLVEKLGFGWEEVHDVAEQLEHIQSVKLTDQLDSYLGNPKYDPHGDPIPDKHGELPQRSELLLSDCDSQDQLLVRGVKDSSRAFLEYLEKLGIGLGTRLEIISKEKFDGSMQIKSIEEGPQMLSQQVCKNLYVKRL
jgi:DtxR family Mn-dependent transcriptional regulator